MTSIHIIEREIHPDFLASPEWLTPSDKLVLHNGPYLRRECVLERIRRTHELDHSRVQDGTVSVRL